MVTALVLDLTVTLGNLISGGMAIAALLSMYVLIRERLARIETKVDTLWAQFERRRGVR